MFINIKDRRKSLLRSLNFGLFHGKNMRCHFSGPTMQLRLHMSHQSWHAREFEEFVSCGCMAIFFHFEKKKKPISS
ncbi:hypothetical protein EUGRSUZ_E01235 [Eucalyptus grandis]|uniref:Uncharacterized protein n=2 Tax=Eucalyptus grandis TaxID=71139 RepID=A0ACC3KTV2_EUCGR|nr:hypothetical protein EUGRSUZ_E01235 [Eucalyptus grandis]